MGSPTAHFNTLSRWAFTRTRSDVDLLKLLKFALIIAASTALSASTHPLAAQNLEPAQIEHPSPDSWPLYHGDYSGKRHSSLTQITPQNVGKLGLAWAFQTNQPAEIKSSPLLVDGILYFTVPDHIWAVDARSGHTLWHYNVPTTQGLHIGHRGVAMYKGWLYYVTPDAHLISLNAKDGSVRWTKEIADVTKGYWTTLAPLIVRNHVIVGVSGDFDNLTGYLRSFDPETGVPLREYFFPTDLGFGLACVDGDEFTFVMANVEGKALELMKLRPAALPKSD